MKEKRLDYELLRLIAIVCVVFNHTQHRGYELYQVAGGSVFNGMLSLILAVVCKIGVPLFLLVSGGLLLHKNESIGTVLQKRVSRIAIALVLFSGVLYGFWIRWGTLEAPGVMDFFSRLWSEGISSPYWYLYGYLGLMLMLPLLRPMAQGMKDETFHYLFLLHVLFQGGVKILSGLLGLGNLYGSATIQGFGDPLNFYLPFLEQLLFYFLMGYYFHHRFKWEKVQGKQLGALWILALVSVAVMISLPLWDICRGNDVIRPILGNLVCFPVLAGYMSVHVLVEKHPIRGKLAAIVSALGGCVFGTYLLEGILRRELLWLYDALEPRIHVLPACIVWVGCVVLFGLAITFVLKKIPLIRKLL